MNTIETKIFKFKFYTNMEPDDLLNRIEQAKIEHLNSRTNYTYKQLSLPVYEKTFLNRIISAPDRPADPLKYLSRPLDDMSLNKAYYLIRLYRKLNTIS